MQICWLGCACGLALLLASCTVERAGGEFGAVTCADRADNDGDQAIDCDDPDCQAEAICGRAAPLREPDGGGAAQPVPSIPSKPGSDAGSTQSPPDPAVDSGTVESPPDMMLPDPDNPPDAGMDPPKMCPVCASDESCIAGYCVPNEAVFVELWDITSIAGVFPRAIDGSCVDVPPCPLAPKPPAAFPLCFCQPEPMVRVSVTRPGKMPEVVAETPLHLANPRADDDEWAVSAQLELRPEYEITLAAFDRDGIFEKPLFECSLLADPELLGSGTLSCEQLIAGKFVASITVAIQPATGGALP